jgi:O-acetyl-ADP-ribose deacetylase
MLKGLINRVFVAIAKVISNRLSNSHASNRGILDNLAGQTVITPIFKVSAKHEIHTACPRYMDGLMRESEQLYNAYASVLALQSEAPDAKSITFVSMGTGVYKGPMALAADIAVKALLTSTFEETLMCVIDEKTRLIYQAALDRYL